MEITKYNNINEIQEQTSPEAYAQINEAFVNDMDVKPSSKTLYKRTLNIFFNWVQTKGYNLNNIALPSLLEYKNELLAMHSPLTTASYLTTLKKFYEWAEANKYAPNVAKGVKLPRREQKFRKQPLTNTQAKDVINNINNLRDKAIINLMLRTGLRCIEVVRANIGDITFKNGQRVLNVWGKGRDDKSDFVILTDKAYKPIEEYLKTRINKGEKEPLFTAVSRNNANNRLTTRSISRIAKTNLKNNGIDAKEYTAHSLRHTAAVMILEASGTTEQAQMMLRHKSPQTTQIYTATMREKQRLSNSGECLIDKMF